MTSCLFCKIRDGEIPATLVHQDDEVFAIADINPQGPVHLLVIPRRHVESANDLADQDEKLAGHLVRVAVALAKSRGVADRGYRLVFNTNGDGGQTVPHLHLHLIAGRPMQWPPG
jgi:histidine triad (HIT) family protein